MLKTLNSTYTCSLIRASDYSDRICSVHMPPSRNKSSTASGAASPPPLHTIVCISARTTSYHVAVLHSVHKNGLESQKTTARVPIARDKK